MRVTLEYGGNTVDLPDDAAVDLIRQGHATDATPARPVIDLQANAIAAALAQRSARIAAIAVPAAAPAPLTESVPPDLGALLASPEPAPVTEPVPTGTDAK